MSESQLILVKCNYVNQLDIFWGRKSKPNHSDVTEYENLVSRMREELFVLALPLSLKAEKTAINIHITRSSPQQNFTRSWGKLIRSLPSNTLLQNFSPLSHFTSILWVPLDGTGWEVSNSVSCFCECYCQIINILVLCGLKASIYCILCWLFTFNGKAKHFVYEMMFDIFCCEHGVNEMQPVIIVTERNGQERDDLDRKVNNLIHF